MGADYGSIDHLDSEEEVEDQIQDDRRVAAYHVHDEELNGTPPMAYGPAEVLIEPPALHSRKKSLSTLTTLEQINRWTRRLIPKWAVTSSHFVESRPNEIQYSVFKSLPGYEPYKTIPLEGFGNNGPTSKAMFENIVDGVIEAIENAKIYPQRIAAGSSGSYFVYNEAGEIVGVFKPKDEEPYGPLSPKWSKFIHRNLFPCFFGRSCLIPNLGYICESAASLLDRQLQTFIVPFTDTVFLSSPTFYASAYDRFAVAFMGRKLPKKVGSFQLFLKGYEQADDFFKRHPLPGTRSWGQVLQREAPGSTVGRQFAWTDEVLLQFREELEKLVILDYIMRNTDRGLDNWMIKLEWHKRFDRLTDRYVEVPELKIGAIDSGLSWPWKHPDEWRSFPFGWLYLPLSIIGQPFSEKTRRHFLPLLTSSAWWEESSVLFREMFSRDTEFKERMWKKQWAVMKGQAFNVVETLKNKGQGPMELVRRTRIIVWDEEMDVPYAMPVSIMANAMETSIWDSSSPSTSRSHRNANGSSFKPQSAGHNRINTILEDEEVGGGGGGGDHVPVDSYSPAVAHSFENYQHNWSQLLNGDIDEMQFEESFHAESPLLTTAPEEHDALTGSPRRGNASSPVTMPVEEGADLRRVASLATKRVIIERLAAVNSKPPVFTWC